MNYPYTYTPTSGNGTVNIAIQSFETYNRLAQSFPLIVKTANESKELVVNKKANPEFIKHKLIGYEADFNSGNITINQANTDSNIEFQLFTNSANIYIDCAQNGIDYIPYTGTYGLSTTAYDISASGVYDVIVASNVYSNIDLVSRQISIPNDYGAKYKVITKFILKVPDNTTLQDKVYTVKIKTDNNTTFTITINKIKQQELLLNFGSYSITFDKDGGTFSIPFIAKGYGLKLDTYVSFPAAFMQNINMKIGTNIYPLGDFPAYGSYNGNIQITVPSNSTGSLIDGTLSFYCYLQGELKTSHAEVSVEQDSVELITLTDPIQFGLNIGLGNNTNDIKTNATKLEILSSTGIHYPTAYIVNGITYTMTNIINLSGVDQTITFIYGNLTWDNSTGTTSTMSIKGTKGSQTINLVKSVTAAKYIPVFTFSTPSVTIDNLAHTVTLNIVSTLTKTQLNTDVTSVLAVTETHSTGYIMIAKSNTSNGVSYSIDVPANTTGIGRIINITITQATTNKIKIFTITQNA